MILDLSAPLAKLDRAHEHLRVLDAETATFYGGRPGEGQPYKIRSEYRVDSRQYVFTVEILREPPLLLGLLLGDYVHNLRAALDHLVCQLARAAGGTCDTTQFPIFSAEPNFVKKAGTLLKGIDPSHRAIIEKLQPYHTGKADRESHFLSVIAWLDNTDKHRVIHPAFGYLHPPEIGGAKGLRWVPNHDAGSVVTHLVANGRRIERDTDIVYLTLDLVGPKPHVDMYGDLVFEPAFGSRWLPATALPQLARRVKDTIALFG